jgi:hypothetical protein
VRSGCRLPPDRTTAVNNPATQLLAKLIGAPAPEGEATSFLDKSST